MMTQRLRTTLSGDRAPLHRSTSDLTAQPSGDLSRSFDTASLRQAARSSRSGWQTQAATPEPLTRGLAARSPSRAITRTTAQRQRSVNLKKATQNTTAEWTVMVYMAGNNLESYAIQDFLELAAAGSDRRVNLVVQIDRTAGYDSSYGNWTDTRRGKVQKNSKPNASWGSRVGEANMGSATALKNFVTWGTNTYKAQHYALVMWGHGDGHQVSYDDATANGISGAELNSVLAGVAAEVDLVGTDACLMSTTDFAAQIADNASVFVGSQELEPGTGWNYTPVIQDLKTNPAMTAAQLGSSLVTRYAQAYSPRNETLSAIDLTALRSSNPNSLTNALNSFATTLASSATSQDLSLLNLWRDRLANVFDTSAQPDDLCDVGRLFSGFASSPGLSASLQVAARVVLSAYSSTVIHNYTAIANRSTGLSLYFSDRGSAPEVNDLSQSAFAPQWSAFVNGSLWGLG
ncbi:MAG: hypothetical protein HY785_27815 [Oscillatoriophycideae cyanobacterium NC_groundwater_1537_Pr4_S-0.65um_50_18]|nr:hypothetical protein [Oscillatoriophycideae cyanobacterium NC_groundwater_1537_Pr4_S-0.65um_50_18]